MQLSASQDLAVWLALSAGWLPFAAFVLIIVFFRSKARPAAGLSLAAVTWSVAVAVFLLAANRHMETPVQFTARWLSSGNLTVPVGCLLDPLSLLMMAIVAGICFLVQVYSLGYMAGDPGFSRYYAFMSLFAWAMINLTLAPSMLQLYIFWELVGVSSYLLIGFWYEKFSASEAGKKAFVMTRLGDVAFLMGILLVFIHFGSLDIQAINGPAAAAGMPPLLLTVSALLIFGGIIGKSAQFPLLTWLPDAMEGPTPVSALLHSATMVAAGVFLFARLFPFFSRSPTAMTVCLAVGTVSMLLASTMAMVSRDIKQVWAYSTISQLGFMIMGLAAGGYVAGVFHLTTHAGFKALLFLCAGVFIHAYGTNDMFDIGRRGGRGLKIPMICMAVAAAALSGIPPFSGFFSKELILATLSGLDNPVWLWAGLAGAFLTAYYTFRLIFIIVFPAAGAGHPGETAGSHPDDAHGHGGYWPMAWPLMVLAAVTAVLGFAQGMLEHFLAAGAGPAAAHGAGGHGWLLYTAMGLCAAGVVLAFVEFGRKGAARKGFVEKIGPLHALFANRWYLDRFYRWLLDAIVYGVFSKLCAGNDNRVIDGGIHALGRSAVGSGRWLSALHLSMIQYRLMVMFVAMILLALYFFF